MSHTGTCVYTLAFTHSVLSHLLLTVRHKQVPVIGAVVVGDINSTRFEGVHPGQQWTRRHRGKGQESSTWLDHNLDMLGAAQSRGQDENYPHDLLAKIILPEVVRLSFDALEGVLPLVAEQLREEL